MRKNEGIALGIKGFVILRDSRRIQEKKGIRENMGMTNTWMLRLRLAPARSMTGNGRPTLTPAPLPRGEGNT